MRTERFGARDVDHVVVRVYTSGARIADDRDMPDINMQHLCALMLVDGFVTIKAAHDPLRMQDPLVMDMRRRISLVGDAALEKLRPEKHAIVEVFLKNGWRVGRHTHAVRGTVQNPMTRSKVAEKALDLMVPVLGGRRARTLCDAIWSIGRISNMRALGPLLVISPKPVFSNRTFRTWWHHHLVMKWAILFTG